MKWIVLALSLFAAAVIYSQLGREIQALLTLAEVGTTTHEEQLAPTFIITPIPYADHMMQSSHPTTYLWATGSNVERGDGPLFEFQEDTSSIAGVIYFEGCHMCTGNLCYVWLCSEVDK